MSSNSSLAARYHKHGTPAEVLVLEPLPVGEPGPGQALVRMLAAPINPSDLGQIGGTYGRLPKLPAVAGREGLGEVVKLGPDTAGPKPGTRVRMPLDMGSWQEALVAPAADLLPVPSNLPLEMAAMAFVNPPTALRLLKDSGLKAGDWLVQNAASSALGFFVVQLARKMGLHTVCVVRDKATWEGPLKEAGADVVVSEDSDWAKSPKTLTGGAPIKLGLNSIGGNSVSNIIRAMGDGGTVVTFGGMSGDLVRFPTRFLIFNDVRLTGFWLDRWVRVHSPAEVKAMFDEVFALIADGTFRAPVDAVYPLAEVQAALAHPSQKGRRGKVLLKADWKP